MQFPRRGLDSESPSPSSSFSTSWHYHDSLTPHPIIPMGRLIPQSGKDDLQRQWSATADRDDKFLVSTARRRMCGNNDFELGSTSEEPYTPNVGSCRQSAPAVPETWETSSPLQRSLEFTSQTRMKDHLVWGWREEIDGESYRGRSEPGAFHFAHVHEQNNPPPVLEKRSPSPTRMQYFDSVSSGLPLAGFPRKNIIYCPRPLPSEPLTPPVLKQPDPQPSNKSLPPLPQKVHCRSPRGIVPLVPVGPRLSLVLVEGRFTQALSK